MELVQSTRGLVSQSPRAAVVTIVSCMVAIVALALLLAGVGSSAGGAGVPVTISTGGLTPQEWRYVQGVEALTPTQRAAAFGTDTEAAATVLARLTPSERLYVQTIGALTPAQLSAAFGTGH